MEHIAFIHSDLNDKFGIPRQSGILFESEARIVFAPKYRRIEAVRGLEGFSHIWLIWEFSKIKRDTWRPTVRPPRLGGNKRVGVFATRSPYRPNPIGLSSVRLLRIDLDAENAPVLVVSGADLLDGTPIYDIKPYLPAFDMHTDAVGGFTDEIPEKRLTVVADDDIISKIPEGKRAELYRLLSCDPRPSYHDDPKRVYGLLFAGFEVRFCVEGERLTVVFVGDGSQSSQ